MITFAPRMWKATCHEPQRPSYGQQSDRAVDERPNPNPGAQSAPGGPQVRIAISSRSAASATREIDERGERLIWLEDDGPQPSEGRSRTGRELQRRDFPTGEGDDANEADEAMIGVNAFVIAALIGVSPALADAVTCSRWQGGLTAARSLGGWRAGS